jgi:hypothetical protein
MVSSLALRREKEFVRWGGVVVVAGSSSIFGDVFVEERRDRVRDRVRERENDDVRESLPEVDAEREREAVRDTGGERD